jgi:DNA-binding CsgD family transcriptional regulator
MSEPKPTSEWARKRAAGKILREALIKHREIYFDLLVSGYSIEEIASHMKKSPSAVRRAVGQALAKRRLDAPEDYARLQVARLTKALRCEWRPEGDCAVRASRAGAQPLPRRQCWRGANGASCAAGNRGDVSAACAHAFAGHGC